MKVFELLRHLALAAYIRVRGAVPDRGDVPGWVMITLMTAGLVGALWLVAGNKLGTMLGNALDNVAPGAGG